MSIRDYLLLAYSTDRSRLLLGTRMWTVSAWPQGKICVDCMIDALASTVTGTVHVATALMMCV